MSDCEDPSADFNGLSELVAGRPRAFSESYSSIGSSGGSSTSTLIMLSASALQVMETGALPSTRKRPLGESIMITLQFLYVLGC